MGKISAQITMHSDSLEEFFLNLAYYETPSALSDVFPFMSSKEVPSLLPLDK